MNHTPPPIKTAIASFGMSGEVFHAPLIAANPRFKLIVICERTTNKAKLLYPNVKVVRTFEELLADPEIELIVVNTPNELHFPMAQNALLANKHVLVEKPFVISVSQGQELMKLAQSKLLTISVFHNRRWDSDILTLQELISNRNLGKLVEMHWHFDRFRPQVTHKKWKEDDLPGAGVLYDLGVHMLDATVHLFGQPSTITCHLRTVRDTAGAPDYFHIRLGYGQFDAYLHSSTLVREKVPYIALHGAKGSFVKYSSDPQESQLKSGCTPLHEGYGTELEEQYGMLHTEKDGEIVRFAYPSTKGCYEQLYDNIADAIQWKTALKVTTEQALNNVWLIEQAIRSHYEQRTITL